MVYVTTFVEIAPHEFTANYIFDEHGLTPWFAADSRIKDGNGSQVEEMHVDGERWVVKLYYQSSNILHPGETNPQGTEFRVGELREFRLAIARHPEEDPVGEQDFNAHLAPRWQGMYVESDDGDCFELSVPDDIHEGVNVTITGSNIQFSRYRKLLSRAFAAVNLNPRYVENPHEHSNIVDAERYVRLDKDRSGPIHARDGPIASMAHLLENDRDGYRKLVQNDRDENGRHLPGYYHTVTLGPQRITETFPSHALPKEVKHYYAREAATKPADDPLAHPKLGASYQVSRWDKKLGVTDDDIFQLERELDETVLATLADAGIPIRPSSEDSPYIADAYFTAGQTDLDRDLVSLDLTELRQEQESIVINHIADGLSPVEWEALSTLVTDGGEVTPQSIADANDRHVDSVRRALNRLPELVEWHYGDVSLRSKHIAKHVHEAVKQAKQATRRAVEAGARAVEAAERGIDETTSALMAWAARHGVDINDSRDARMVLRMGSLNHVKHHVEEAYRLWCDAGKDLFGSALPSSISAKRAEVRRGIGSDRGRQLSGNTIDIPVCR